MLDKKGLLDKEKLVIFWFRRDLRLEDNIGLFHALESEFRVLPIFIFDTEILEMFDDKKDRRVDYIHQALTVIHQQLKKDGSGLRTFHGNAFEVIQSLTEEFDVQTVFCNRDYEPQAIQRDTAIYNYLKGIDIPFKAYKDQVVFDKKDILKADGNPYTVYTPYSKKWKENLQAKDYAPVKLNFKNLVQFDAKEIHGLSAIGFEKTDIVFEMPKLKAEIIDTYDKTRDFPGIKEGTTKMGVALRFGTISVRKCVAFALEHNQIWLSELIWREFFMQILYHFPKVVDQSFKKKYDAIEWRNDEDEFVLWCQGKTGYPIVDAGMRELNQTGYMHNRVRMIVASFLCKHLLIDWQWGEAYFAQKLNDYDLSANNGNWQWAAGSGCDAAPYFRVFSPELQTNKFDKDLKYIKKWVPELETVYYPKPMVEHKVARIHALEVYGRALKDK